MIQKLLLAFVTLIVGLVLVGQVATTGYSVTNQAQVVDETVSLAGARLTNFTGSVINETGFINHTGYTLAKASVPGFRLATFSLVTNISTETIVAANYTLNTGTNIVTNATQDTWLTANFSYTYVYGPAAGAINTTYYFHLAQACPGSDWRIDDSSCSTTEYLVENATGTDLTDNTDYVIYPTNGVCTGVTAGDIRFLNTALVNRSNSNTTTVTYGYCPEGYLTQSWQRVILDLVPGFFAIALLIFSVGMFYSVAKEAGIL